MKHIITFSGGKDSLATIVWAKKNLSTFEIVFCDTGWESEITYQHIKDVEKWLNIKVVYLKNDKFKDMIDLFIKKGRAASTKARFCTEEMKVKPMIDYILSQNEDVIVYQGVRADESQARKNLKKNDEYFKFYFEPYGYDKKGKPKFHTYRKSDVFKMCDKYSVDVCRPILNLNAQEVFDLIFSSGLKANPLYYEGFSRVGCFPCIMARHDEIKLIAKNYKERIDEIRQFEKKTGRTFFPPNYIPERFCSVKTVSKKTGAIKYAPSIDDVVNYIQDNPDQIQMFDTPSCISVYNICEK